MQQVFDVEARYGNDPSQVIDHLRPLEAPARASGGDDLRAFLAAWGYAHGATDKPAVADAAVEELTDIGERTHDAGGARLRLHAEGLAAVVLRPGARGLRLDRGGPALRPPGPQPRPALLGRDDGRRPGDEQRPARRRHPPVRGRRAGPAARCTTRAARRRPTSRWCRCASSRARPRSRCARPCWCASSARARPTAAWWWSAGCWSRSPRPPTARPARRAARAREQAVKAQREIAARLGTPRRPAAGAIVETMNSQAGQVAWLSSEQDGVDDAVRRLPERAQLRQGGRGRGAARSSSPSRSTTATPPPTR